MVYTDSSGKYRNGQGAKRKGTEMIDAKDFFDCASDYIVFDILIQDIWYKGLTRNEVRVAYYRALDRHKGSTCYVEYFDASTVKEETLNVIMNESNILFLASFECTLAEMVGDSKEYDRGIARI